MLYGMRQFDRAALFIEACLEFQLLPDNKEMCKCTLCMGAAIHKLSPVLLLFNKCSLFIAIIATKYDIFP